MSSTSAEILQRLQAARNRPPSLDKGAVEAAFGNHLRALGLEPLPVNWCPDPIRGYHYAALCPDNRVYQQAYTNWASIYAVAWDAADVWAQRLVENEAHGHFYKLDDHDYNDLEGFKVLSHEARERSLRDWEDMIAGMKSVWLSAARSLTQTVMVRAIWLPLVEAYEGGLWLYCVLKDEVFAIPRPITHVQGGRLHCETGPAISWEGGPNRYCWHGVQVPEHVVLRPHTITLLEMLEEENTEVQRVMIERSGGMQKLVRRWGKTLDAQPYGTLHRLYLPPGEYDRWWPIMVVEVTCPSTGRKYFLRVPPEMRTVRRAIAWTFGLRAKNYHPVQET